MELIRMQADEKGVLKSSDIYFSTPSNIAKNIFFYLLCAGEFHCAEGYQVKRNDYNSFLMMLIQKGQGNVYYNDRLYIAGEKNLVLLNCHFPHEYDTRHSWETQWIHFDGNKSADFFNLIYNRSGCIIPLKSSSIIPGYFKEILNSFRSGRELPEPLLSSYIHSMLSELLLFPIDESPMIPSTPSPIQIAVQFIETHYKQKLTLELLASQVNLSVYHFARRFKKEIGYAPYEYLLKMRIGQAKILLKRTVMPIKEVAYESGFSNESSFVFCFHKNVGITPAQFRNTPF
jgi:AraC family transcriptional regulator